MGKDGTLHDGATESLELLDPSLRKDLSHIRGRRGAENDDLLIEVLLLRSRVCIAGRGTMEFQR